MHVDPARTAPEHTTTPLQFSGIAAAHLPPGPLHLAIGIFDGVHLGHRAAIEPAVRAARLSRGVAAVLTFWPHPSALFRPNSATRLIQSPATKARVLGTVGVDAVITETFTPALSQIAAEEFLPWLKRQLPTLVAVYIGENFRFGRERKGDVTLMKQAGEVLGVQVHSTPRLSAHGEAISSTRIRGHLSAGEIEVANALLGYTYFSDGVVAPGKRLGRTLGFPTLNLSWSPELRPRFGVYAVRVRGAKSPNALDGVANYGLRPTVENASEPKLEVHVLGECPYGPDDHLIVEWLHFIRPEQKFENLGALKEQIARDRQKAADLLGRTPPI